MNSALNPEAPEFYPHMQSVTQDAYTTMRKTIKISNTFPSGTSYDYYNTFDNFHNVKYQLSENVIAQSNGIIVSEMSNVKLKQKDMDYNMDIIIDSNDRVLDKIEINMNTLNNGTQDHNFATWNNNLVITKTQVGAATLITAKNILKPQLRFKDIDNSNRLWVPIIFDKPNNIKPLALTIIYDDNGEAVGYEHPYKLELKLYEPPPEFLEPDVESISFPPAMDKTRFTYINTEAQLDQLVQHLSTVNEIAVDVEHHSYRSYLGITCLIQISTDKGGDFIIDAIAVRDQIHKLNLSFTDPKKVKVFHGAENDVLWLQRDFGVYIVGLFDTYQAAKALRLSGLSLQHLLTKYCGINPDKKYQLADWRIRPLPNELVLYARTDTHYLLYVWRRMRSELLSLAGGEPTHLRTVFYNSKLVCLQTYKKTVVDENSHLSLYLRSKRTFNSRQMAALKMLYNWRDQQGRILDESTSYLLPNHMVLALAEALPREMQGISACCTPMPTFVKQNLQTIHRMLLLCRELPLEAPECAAPSVPETRLPPAEPYESHDLSHVPETERDVKIDENDNQESSIAILQDDNKIENDFDQCFDKSKYVAPYKRYVGYRLIAKREEDKVKKNKSVAAPALAQGDHLVKPEVLKKLQASKTVIQIEGNKVEDIASNDTAKSDEITFIRKRKIPTDKSKSNAQPETIAKDTPSTSQDANKVNSNKFFVKSFNYTNVNYKKFREQDEQSRKQPKLKFKNKKHT